MCTLTKSSKLTNNHYIGFTVILSAILSVVFFIYLPIEVADHRPGNALLLAVNAGFLAITLSCLVIAILISITHWDLVLKQFETFSRFRHLLLLMVKRDFVTRYRRSVLGVLWSILNPLLTMAIITMVFAMLFRDMGIENFPVYFLGGQLVFSFFSESTVQAMASVTSGASIIKKIYLPKYIFPMSKVFSSLVNMGFSLIAFLFVFFITGVPFKWTMLLIPIPIIYLLIFCLGVGMLLSAMSVFFRDLSYIWGVGIMLLQFLTPIFYPVSILPTRVFYLIHLNPLFHYVEYFRDLTLNGTIPNLWSNIICIGFAMAALGLGVYVKLNKQDKYILYL